MRWIVPLDEIKDEDLPRVGGKCIALFQLARRGFNVPAACCVPVTAYDHYIDGCGLRERILMELSRKDLKEMRWEEIWDASLRIRNLFLRGPAIGEVFPEIRAFLEDRFPETPVVVRSSSPEEDSRESSFAGIHESFVNVRGVDSIERHVKLVWASLWSDSAILYRQELHLDPALSAMAVIVQELIQGERSGVVFSRSPNRSHEGVLEAVYGLNQGLVDGVVQPDRWVFDRETLRVVSHSPAPRDHFLTVNPEGVRTAPAPPRMKRWPPLKKKEVCRLASLSLKSEKVFGMPQDMEWTIAMGRLWILQSRPITSIGGTDDRDKRRWYLSLKRSFENLKQLRNRIESELIPGMIADAVKLGDVNLEHLNDRQLCEEIFRRSDVEKKWAAVYWEEFIPFAHGMRLFGQVYNDVMRPDDPYEFVALLAGSSLESVRRNEMLEAMASMVRQDEGLRRKLTMGRHLDAGEAFLRLIDGFIGEFGDLSCPVTGAVQCDQGPEALVRMVLELAEGPSPSKRIPQRDVEQLEEAFLSRFPGERRREAVELLDLARASYRLRDDDNIHLGRIEARKLAAVSEANRRINRKGRLDVPPDLQERLAAFLAADGELSTLRSHGNGGVPGERLQLKPRQLVGQPAGPGICRGAARVIRETADLVRFKKGEVLVCDAVDPNMTFVVPLASGIVERRGGMLIHGAIIAREYGLPCVTGVPDVIRWVCTGDSLTVDGYLGIVTVGAAHSS
ncbi:MAG: hypothetical protein GX443_05565 [Deltaproteobacteria bacterium]|nr:hypothetical protein [Deltaproteobacteria bacterium]